MTRCTASHERNATRHLLGGFNTEGVHLTVTNDALAAFRDTVFSGNYVPVLLNHEVDADVRGALLTRFGQEYDVAIQLYAEALQQDHHHHAGSHIVLIVERATTVDIAVLTNSRKRVRVPLLRLHAHDVCVTHDQDRGFPAVSA